MTCDEARLQLLALQRGTLSAEREREVALHLEACAACRRARDEEQVLTELLERRLPVHPASAALKRRVAELAPAAPRAQAERRPAARRRWTALAPSLAAAAVVAVVAGALLQRASRPDGALAAFASEAVNDHLRVLQRSPPVDIESGGTHQVKPWFEGKLDFAPAVPAPVDAEMRLQGGALGYFIDRAAAVLVYGVRRHVVTLLVFRADGLAWPSARAGPEARTPVRADVRGFHVFLWRSGDLGYALVGDVASDELGAIAAKLAAQT